MGTKELIALLKNEMESIKTENQMLKKQIESQSEKRFMEMFAKLESKLNDLVETTEETKFILQTENKNLNKKLEDLNAHVNALELAHNQTKPDTPQQNNDLEDERYRNEPKIEMEYSDSDVKQSDS